MRTVPVTGRSDPNRRRRQIERQLRALRVMESHLTTKDIVWAVLTLPAATLLCLLVAAKLHWLSNSLPLAIGGMLAAGFVVWWIGRHWFAVAWFIVVALVCIILEDVPQFDIGDFGDNQKKKEKISRRDKLEKAIARREALLRAMDGSAP